MIVRPPRLPLDAVQIDHVEVDAVLLAPDGEAIGRPWISLAIDLATRMIVGLHVSAAPPTRLSAGLCLLHAVCDKTRWQTRRGLDAPWPCAGLPRRVATDARSFFGGRRFALACRALGVVHADSAPRPGGYGGHVEALIGQNIGAAVLVRGGAPLAAGRRRPEPPRDLIATETWLGAQIAVYHARRHPDLRRSPLAAWTAQDISASSRTPDDCLRFRLSFFPQEDCTLEPDGLKLGNATYWSRGLEDDLAAGRPRLAVRYDPRDMSRIFVERPSGRFVKARAQQAERAETPVSAEAPDCSRKCLSACPFEG